MTTVTMTYTCKNGETITMTSDEFSNTRDANQWKNFIR